MSEINSSVLATVRAEWPLVGRDEELARVSALIGGDARGVVLAGPAGVGKSRLGREVLEAAADLGRATARVSATQAASTLPFGAFAAVLDVVGGGSERSEMLRSLGQAVAALGDGRLVTLLVDDSHLLDDASAALVHQLVTAAEVFVVVTLRSGEQCSDAIMALWKDGLAERIELSPLTRADFSALLRVVLGGHVDEATVRLLWDRTAGNVMFLRELVASALETDEMSDTGGVWHLNRTFFDAPMRLVELVEARLSGLTEPERRALEVLAVGEPLRDDVVVSLLDGDEGLHGLDARGLLRSEETDRAVLLRLSHPLYGEVTRSRLSPLRNRAISRSLADALESRPARRREDVLLLAKWRLDGGGDVEPDLMLRASRQALDRADFVLSERLARAAMEAGGGIDAGLLLGQVLWLTGQPQAAENVLGSLEVSGDDQLASLADLRMNILALTMARIEDAMRVGELAEAAMTGVSAINQLRAKRTSLLLMHGKVRDAAAVVELLLDTDDPRTLMSAAVYGASILALTGRLSEAIELTARGRAALSAPDPMQPMTEHLYVAVHAEALIYAGRLDEAQAVLAVAHDSAMVDSWAQGQPFTHYVFARVMLARGRPREAERYAREAALRCRMVPTFSSHLRVVLPALIQALALVGETDEASSLLTEIDALPSGFRADEAQVIRSRAWTSVAQGDAVSAASILRAGAEMTVDSGELVFEAELRHDLVRLGHAAEVAPRLAELAELVEGDLMSARSAHASASAASDPAGLEEVSVRFEGMGANLFAAEAAADAAVAWRRAGEPRNAAAATRRVETLAARCEGAHTLALSALDARAGLSPRELEIARLAAAGASNKEIADRLVLSVRTVENKLHDAYAKLGVRGRAELARALGG